MAKWQRMAILGRRITIAKRDASLTNGVDALHCSVAEKGHFVVYTVDSQRFTVPLSYLDTKIFRELFRISEEEFGLPRDGPIIIPCDAASMKYIMSMLARQVSKDVEKALLSSIVVPCHSTCSLAPVGVSREVAICSL